MDLWLEELQKKINALNGELAAFEDVQKKIADTKATIAELQAIYDRATGVAKPAKSSSLKGKPWSPERLARFKTKRSLKEAGKAAKESFGPANSRAKK